MVCKQPVAELVEAQLFNEIKPRKMEERVKIIKYFFLIFLFAFAHAAEKPNILLILVDDLGYGDLSSFGATDLHSPAIDGLMEKGMRFDQFYANSPVCSPTRASILTGRYPDLAGVPGVIRTNEDNSWGYFHESAITLPQLLKNANYHTAIIGKWHLGLEKPNQPNDRGFDFFHGFLGDMMDDYYTHLRKGNNYMRLNNQEINPKGHATELFTDWAIDYLKNRKDKEEPFFLYLAYNAPHFPIQPPEDWLEKVKKREPQLSEKRAKNVAFVEHMDFNIGKVLNSLEKTGLAENTLVIFTSDNGGSLRHAQSNGRLHGGKQQMFEGGIRVPTCAVWPGKIKPQTRSNAVGISMDLYATLAEVAGVSIEHEVDAVTLLPIFTGQKSELDERTLIWVRREGHRYGGRAYYAARRGDMKLLQNHALEPMQLFNLGTDELETNPLSDDHPAYKDLNDSIREHIQRSGAIPWQKMQLRER